MSSGEIMFSLKAVCKNRKSGQWWSADAEIIYTKIMGEGYTKPKATR